MTKQEFEKYILNLQELMMTLKYNHLTSNYKVIDTNNSSPYICDHFVNGSEIKISFQQMFEFGKYGYNFSFNDWNIDALINTKIIALELFKLECLEDSSYLTFRNETRKLYE